MQSPLPTAATDADRIFKGKALVSGEAEGGLLVADVGLSFWGGVDPHSGIVIDRHHPLDGQDLAGRVLAIPRGRGSCSGSGVLMELLLNGRSPAAIVVCEEEDILTLGVLATEAAFGVSIPILRISPDVFAGLGSYGFARLAFDELEVFHASPTAAPRRKREWTEAPESGSSVALTEVDRALLSGTHGKAAQLSMSLLVKVAERQGASRLLDVSQVHVDGCIYTGPASLRFAQLLVGWGGRVRVPTTLNSISVDRRRWREQGVNEGLGQPASDLADAYVALGAQPSFTCAPYLLTSAPGFGEQVGWAESNAVVYANSVLGARTMKYPDFLDVCIALTGRAPLSGCHLDSGRRATIAIDVAFPDEADDSFWPLLGYCCGGLSGQDIPLVRGLEATAVRPDDLKAFGAAFATLSSAPMFHMAGVTPEADGQAPARVLTIQASDLRRAWEDLNTAQEAKIDLVSLGNPHFSQDECARLAELVRGRVKSSGTDIIVACGREMHEAALKAGHVAGAEAFGVKFVTDTCWCMIGEPIIPRGAMTLMTNSGKYAHYAPGLVGRSVRFGSLAACIDAACSGEAQRRPPEWLQP